MVDKCAKLVKARDAERQREGDEDAEDATSGENKENEADMEEETPTEESGDKTASKLDGGGAKSAEKTD